MVQDAVARWRLSIAGPGERHWRCGRQPQNSHSATSFPFCHGLIELGEKNSSDLSSWTILWNSPETRLFFFLLHFVSTTLCLMPKSTKSMHHLPATLAIPSSKSCSPSQTEQAACWWQLQYCQRDKAINRRNKGLLANTIFSAACYPHSAHLDNNNENNPAEKK